MPWKACSLIEDIMAHCSSEKLFLLWIILKQRVLDADHAEDGLTKIGNNITHCSECLEKNKACFFRSQGFAEASTAMQRLISIVALVGAVVQLRSPEPADVFRPYVENAFASRPMCTFSSFSSCSQSHITSKNHERKFRGKRG